MGISIQLRDVLKGGTPREEGARLAALLLERYPESNWKDITVKMRHMPAELSNVSFFYGFLQKVFEERPERLEEAKQVRWDLTFESQSEMVEKLIGMFKPRPPASAAAT